MPMQDENDCLWLWSQAGLPITRTAGACGKELKPPLEVAMLGYLALLKRAWAAAVQVLMSASVTDWS